MSAPVSCTVIGCVQGGKFWSRQYTYQVKSYIDGKWQAASLDAYEGKTIQIAGALSPGDRLPANVRSTLVGHFSQLYQSTSLFDMRLSYHKPQAERRDVR
jgi:hypothetical protein